MNTRRVLFSIVMIWILSVTPTGHAQVSEETVSLAIDWWDANYRFRKPLAIINKLDFPQNDFPIFAFIEVEKGSIFSGAQELRVVSENSEIPSYVIYENLEDGLVTGVHLFFVIDLLPFESTSVDIYYGYADAGIPEYRTGGASPNLPVSLSFDESNQEFEIDFGGQYGHSFSFMLRDASSAFSSAGLSGSSFDIISDWSGVGSISSSFDAARVVLGGRSLTLVITGVWQEKEIWLSSLLINTGSSGTGLTSLTGLFDFSNLIQIGAVEGFYDSLTDTFQVGVTGTWFGIANRDPIRSFDVVESMEARDVVSTGRLQGRVRASNDVALVATRSIGFLSPGESRDDLWIWSVAGSREEARFSTIDLRDGVSIALLSLEVPDTPIPVANILYRSTIDFINSSFPSEGFDISLDTQGAQIIESWSRLEGDVLYTLPDQAAFAFEEESDFWVENEEREESGVAYSSSSHLSVERDHIGRLWAISGEEGSSNVSLISQPIVLDGIRSAFLNFSYLSSYSPRSNASGQFWLSFDYNDDEVADRTIGFPINGLNYSLASPPYGFIVPDGRWNDIYIDLSNFLSSERFTIRIGMQVNVTQGIVEFNLDDLSLLVRGDASKIMIASPSSEGVRVERIGTLRIKDILGEMTLEFQTVSSQLFFGGEDGKFQVEFTTPLIEQIESSSAANETLNIRTQPHLALIHTSRPSSTESITINDQEIDPNDAIRISGLAVLEKDLLEIASNSIRLEYIFGRLRVDAIDVIGVRASGVDVIARDSFGRDVTSGITGGDGSVTLQIAPSTYQVELYYHNRSIGSRIVVIESDVTLRAEVPLFQVRLRVIDRFGQPVESARISLLLSNATVAQSLTGANGLGTFALVGQEDYRVMVERSGQVIYESGIRANIYGATLDLVTETIPVELTVGVGIILVGSALGVIVYMFKRRGL